MAKFKILVFLSLFIAFSSNIQSKTALSNKSKHSQTIAEGSLSKKFNSVFIKNETFIKLADDKKVKKKIKDKTRSKIRIKEEERIKLDIDKDSYPRGWESKNKKKAD